MCKTIFFWLLLQEQNISALKHFGSIRISIVILRVETKQNQTKRKSVSFYRDEM